MGVTIHYRGALAEMSRVEDFEDRVIDMALAVGGNPRLWRSANENDPSRMVRGLLIDLAPGQETTSLLLSPEGWLIGFMQIEEAERGDIPEKPWCWVKTQFGPIEGHVALVELLTGIKKEFMPDLEVMDEGGYWEERDFTKLRQRIEFLGRAIDMLAEALDNDRLSPEAREDPAIVATRIERLARKIHATLARPAEHPPIQFPDDSAGLEPKQHEALWDASFAEQRRKQERMERVMEEERIRGEDARTAFEAAIREVVPEFEFPTDDSPEHAAAVSETEEPWADDSAVDEPADVDDATFADDDGELYDEPWRESLPDAVASGDEETRFARMERHPLQRQAKQLLTEFFDLAERADQRSTNIDTLMRNALEITGGLAQVLPLPPSYEIDDLEAGLGLVQLKRALRGTAFVRGTLFLLRADKTITDEELRHFMDEADAISSQITELLRSIRESYSG